MNHEVTFRVNADGSVEFIYSDELRQILEQNGVLKIARASHVEPGIDNKWYADLSLINGPKLGPFEERMQALTAEFSWIEENYLGRANSGEAN
jgi:hypothetical protein